MAAIKLQTTAEDIRKMSENEWQEYRKKSWLRKREYYSQELPNYYLPNREGYAKYLEKIQERISKRNLKNAK